MRPLASRPLALLGAMLLLGGLLARVTLLGRDAGGLTAPPFEDDSYYEQSYARAIVQGQFFTLNGVQRGDAYHPIFPLVCAPLQLLAGSDLVRGVKYVLALDLVLFILTAW